MGDHVPAAVKEKRCQNAECSSHRGAVKLRCKSSGEDVHAIAPFCLSQLMNRSLLLAFCTAVQRDDTRQRASVFSFNQMQRASHLVDWCGVIQVEVRELLLPNIGLWQSV